MRKEHDGTGARDLLEHQLIQLVGKECWSLTNSIGTVILPTFGKKIPRARKLPNPKLPEILQSHEGEYSFIIYSSWILELGKEVLVAWEDVNEDRSDWLQKVNSLVGEKVTNTVLKRGSLGFELHFYNGRSLNG